MAKQKSEKVLTLQEALAARAREGTLYHKLDNNRVHCYACGHNCKIPPGRFGVCRVRFNKDGKLLVPWGYVGGLQVDPVEKKPFFHALPGALAMSFGMLGCDFHCSYCFTGETIVMTNRGPITLSEAFESAKRVDQVVLPLTKGGSAEESATGSRYAPPSEGVERNALLHDAEIAYPKDLYTVAASGQYRKARAVFKHPYCGELVALRPFYLPELRCTPDHRVYATDDVRKKPEKIEARRLTDKHYLAIPRRYESSDAAKPVPSVAERIDVPARLSEHQVTYRIPWRLSVEDREFIVAATHRGETSRQIGATIGKDASYVRHICSKIARGKVRETQSGGPIVEDRRIRFPNERRPGIPAMIPLDTDMARLLGYYCAEGCVTSAKDRPNSHTLNFSFSYAEPERVAEVSRLLHRCLNVKASQVKRKTTLALAVSKASAALLFKSMAGENSREKRVPQVLFDAPKELIRAFLEAYIDGDGYRYGNSKISVTTVSRALAYGIAWLALRTGYLPSLYKTPTESKGVIQGRSVERAPRQYTVVWYEGEAVKRKVIETPEHYLIPLREVASVAYQGDVYNMEVESEHNYLAGFFLVGNCQNWVTSQALRDPIAGAPPQDISPEQITSLALRYGADIVTSTYNEPLITSEWALDIFKIARKRGLVTSYVSNGNGTPEVIDALKPWVDLYKVDLKGFNDKNYRQLGGVLQNVLDTIRMLYEKRFWVEIVTLIVPGFNDSDEEIREIADFIVSVSPDIPWHVTAFHQDYKMTEPDNTSSSQIIRAAEIGYEAGLHYVYAGNRPGQVGRYENTCCPNCGELLVERWGFRVLKNRIKNGNCPKCQTKIPGVWSREQLHSIVD
jgi:pyruvate formate lyase activating enzyme